MTEQPQAVFTTIEFDRVDKRPLKFEGTTVASVDIRDFDCWDAGAPRWTELFVYRTRGGKFILRSANMSSEKGEVERNKAIILDTLDERKVMDFFEQFWLSKELYAELGMDPTVEID